MLGIAIGQRIFLLIDGTLEQILEGFNVDRKSRGLSERIIDFYVDKIQGLKDLFMKGEF